MESEAFKTLVELYGLPGIVIAMLLLACRALWVAYRQESTKSSEIGVKVALAMERNTQAIESLKELIKDRK
ncbi:hypothetical protein OLZ32_28145 [Rhizobium sp. 1AS11]|uniref:hypothetical protein n=1 Tax=Rhizobium acaciae TaxID=2989736 RepID=UPI0022217D47|nr:hypothetical protein [Rhizobium acaciae]MCW1412225.1 hypothetical protein [Rhizobium acaciae]MCW1744240.1 hypothetical protein [Rhizobium acaciae]